MAQEILQMNEVELREKAEGLRKRIAELRFDKATGRLLDASAPRKTKKELARILTRQRQVSSF